MEALVLVDGEYSASLDRMTLAGDLILEIKAPWKGRDSELWKQVTTGDLPEHYRWQVAHQLMVTKAELAHVYVFDGTEGVLLEVRPEPGGWDRIREGWDAFMDFVRTDKAPPLSERDTLLRNDAEWQQCAAAFLMAKRLAAEAGESLDAAKEALVALTQHSSESGAGLTVTRFLRAGAIDYKKVPELRGVDLERYRSAPRLETRITVAG
jgi:hypothetical protein